MSQATQQRTQRRESYLDPFGIRVDVEGSSVVVRVSGELDMASSPLLAAVLAGFAASGPGAVVVDLSDVTFVDTRSVGVIAAAHERLGFGSVGLTIRAPSPVARRLLELVGLTRLIEAEGPSGPSPRSGLPGPEIPIDVTVNAPGLLCRL